MPWFTHQVTCNQVHFLSSNEVILTNVNSFTLGAPKRDLTFLEIFHIQKHFCEKKLRRNVDHKPKNNSPSFRELSHYSQVIFKSMRVADDTFFRDSEC